MDKQTCIINGHPDPSPEHYIPALADAYEAGAQAAGFATTRINVGQIEFECLRRPSDFGEAPSQAIRDAQKQLLDSQHVALFFPIWLSAMPAYTRAFIEQMGRSEFMIHESDNGFPQPQMRDKSLRIVCTMGMPAVAYRVGFGAFGVRSLEKGVFGLAGFHPIHHTLIGGIEGMTDTERNQWLGKIGEMGRKGQ